MAGLPIPVRAYGPWDRLSYDIDYGAMFNAAALDPERLANLPADIAGQATNFGVKLPGLGGSEGTGGGLIEGLPGGAAGGALQNLLGGGEQTQAEEGPTPTGQDPSPSEEQEQPSIIPDAGKLLKRLRQ